MNKRKTLLDRREREKKKNTTIWWWWWWSGRRRRRKRRHWHTQKEREEAALENNASSHLLTYLDISRRKIAGTIQHTHTRTSVKCTTYRNDDKHLERKRSRFQSQASDRWKEKKNSASAVGILLREFRTRLKYLPSTGGVWICAKAASWIRSVYLSYLQKTTNASWFSICTTRFSSTGLFFERGWVAGLLSEPAFSVPTGI